MSYSVMPLDRSAPCRIHRDMNGRGSGRKCRSRTFEEMKEGVARLVSVDDTPELPIAGQLSRITHLPAHFSVERADIQNHGGLVFERHDIHHLGLTLKLVVAHELSRCRHLDLGNADHFSLLSGSRPSP